MAKGRWLALLVMSAGLMAWTACQGGKTNDVYTVYTGGNAHRGKQLIEQYRCGACHVIPGVENAKGLVGPPLMWWGRRTFIGGELPNKPQNLQRWLLSPKSVEPGTAMPTLGLTPQQARDVSAYLYTLR